MEETMILLRFNCPEPTCDYIAAAGWGDLKLHARGVHGRQMWYVWLIMMILVAHDSAVMCVSATRRCSPMSMHCIPLPCLLFTCLLSLVVADVGAVLPCLQSKLKAGYILCASSAGNASLVGTSFTPICENSTKSASYASAWRSGTSSELHFDTKWTDGLYSQDSSFQNYMALERHFTTAHFPCQQDECLAKKFVVFGSAMDLQGHMVEEHGAAMTSKDRREAMKIQADFAFEDTNAGRGRRGVPGSAPHPPPAPPPQPGSSRGGRRRDFGGHLTTDNAAPPPPPPPRAPSPTGGPLTDDPEIIE
jgi:hypothetical protein